MMYSLKIIFKKINKYIISKQKYATETADCWLHSLYPGFNSLNDSKGHAECRYVDVDHHGSSTEGANKST